MQQLVFSIYLKNPEEAESNAREGINLPPRMRIIRQRDKPSFFHILSTG